MVMDWVWPVLGVLLGLFMVRMVVLSVWDAWVPVLRSRKTGAVTADAGAVLAWKRERFVREERQWLLAWIAADESGMRDIRRRWYKTYAYWVEALSEQQERQLEKHLVYWARRRVENLSQYGKGGWEGTGWKRPDSVVR
jgi:hypothetical protein